MLTSAAIPLHSALLFGYAEPFLTMNKVTDAGNSGVDCGEEKKWKTLKDRSAASWICDD
jgi:hypothetical protein